MSRFFLFTLLLTATILIGGACSKDAPKDASKDNGDVPAGFVPAPADDGTVDVVEIPQPTNGEAKEFSITAKQFDFEPSTITVNMGDLVRLHVTSADVAHGIAINQFGVNTVLNVGETKTIEFTADKTGSFGFFCSVFCGSGHGGMKGVINVK